ncbi:AMP-dependent synthetase/ligase [Streptomyces sp. SCSIO ZS0520]|uniref:AMP-dependent synthetase/ligase n=1 Tax=Streptomyces sp. SCSIO ZS0520 TaxID=2892996 RepID=UPI0021D7F62C|nr:AMP-dependent synthetase/ligase [Streptomyces sp. SCSIO ZS0520]
MGPPSGHQPSGTAPGAAPPPGIPGGHTAQRPPTARGGDPREARPAPPPAGEPLSDPALAPDRIRRLLAEAPSLAEVFQHTVAAVPDRVALRSSDGAVSYTWAEYDRRVRELAAGFAALGVGRGDTVALMLGNGPDFHLVDAALFHLGAVPFSVYNTSTPEQIAHVLANADNAVAVCEEAFLPRLRAAAADRLRHLVCTDGQPDGARTLAEVAAAGDPGFDFDAVWRRVGRQDVLTLIYTSGTTGPPKGVELTHGNILTNLGSLANLPELADRVVGGRLVSYLPDAHLANRYFAHYLAMITASSVTTVRDIRTVIEVLRAVHPTVFLGVPMFWYKIKAAVDAAVAAERGPKGHLARWAVRTGLEASRRSRFGGRRTLSLRLRHTLAERLVLARLREGIGLHRTIAPGTGAAPIAQETLEFFLGLGLPLLEGWGMSELSAVATMNRPGDIRPGSVGRALDGVELRLAEDGELLARGEIVMKGYRRDAQRTAEALDAEGWLHTGDIATIDAAGFVRIVDRKKELLINSAGKNMSPSNIENALRASCPLAASVVAVGDRRPYVVALVVLDPQAAPAFAERHGIHETSAAALAAHPLVRAAVERAVAEANGALSRVEQIRKYALLPVFWEPGGEELTPTLKLRRRPILEKYAQTVEALYASDERRPAAERGSTRPGPGPTRTPPPN